MEKFSLKLFPTIIIKPVILKTCKWNIVGNHIFSPFRYVPNSRIARSFCQVTLEYGMATNSSILAWKVDGLIGLAGCSPWGVRVRQGRETNLIFGEHLIFEELQNLIPNLLYNIMKNWQVLL